MKLQSVAIVALAITLTGCGSCGSDTPQTAELYNDIYEVNGERFGTNSALIRPSWVQLGDTTEVVMALPEPTAEVAVRFEPTQDCSSDCDPEWRQLEFRESTGLWHGEATAPTDAPRVGREITLKAVVRALGAEPSGFTYDVGIASDSDSYNVVVWDRQDVVDACGNEALCELERNVVLYDYEGTDLQILAGVDRFVGGVTIMEAPNLQSFDGVEGTTYVQNLTVKDAPQLIGVSGFQPAFVNSMSFEDTPSIQNGASLLPTPGEIDERWERAGLQLFSNTPLDMLPENLSVLKGLGVRKNNVPFEIAIDGEVLLDSLTLMDSGITGISGLVVRDAVLHENESLETIDLGLSNETRRIEVKDHASLRSLTLFGDTSGSRGAIVDISDAPELRTIQGLETIEPPSTLYLNNLPNVSRCDVEEQLHPEFRDAPWLETLGPCD